MILSFLSRHSLAIIVAATLGAVFNPQRVWAHETSIEVQELYSHGNPTSDEQELLENFNRVRADPAGEGRSLADWLRNSSRGQNIVRQYGTNPDQVAGDLAAYAPMPPVAMNAQLLKGARAYSREIANHNGVYPPAGPHYGYDRSTASSRAAAAGYTGGIGTGKISGGFNGEVASSGQVDTFTNYAGYLVDWGNPGFGHRKIIMNVQREVGVGNALIPASFNSQSPLVNICDFGVDGFDLVSVGKDQVLTLPAPSLLVGVASCDINGNGRYDAGEGVAGVTVAVDGGKYYAVSGASGGYTVPLVKTDGTNFQSAATVRFRGLPGETERVQAVTLRKAYEAINKVSYLTNVKLDAVVKASALPVVTVKVGNNGQISRAAGGKLKLIVRRISSDTSKTLTIKYKTLGTAIPNVDYRALPGTLVIRAGVMQAKIKLGPILNGEDDTSIKTVVLQVKGASGDVVVSILP